jgi:mono/diheme cytochrome c family protein
MLRGMDKGLAIVTWTVAAVLAVMLLVGPKVVADDKGKKPAAGKSPYASQAASGAAAADGKALFVSNCGSCHTLSAAGTSGAIGPKLDGLGVDAATVTAAMKAGPGAMPTFSLSPAETAAIAKFVQASSR